MPGCQKCTNYAYFFSKKDRKKKRSKSSKEKNQNKNHSDPNTLPMEAETLDSDELEARLGELDDYDRDDQGFPSDEVVQSWYEAVIQWWAPRLEAVGSERHMGDVFHVSCRRLGISDARATSSDFDWNEFDAKWTVHKRRVVKLQRLFNEDGVSGERRDKLQMVTRLIYSLSDLFMSTARVYNCMQPDALSRRVSMPPGLREEGSFRNDCENVHEHDPTKLNAYQSVFLHLRKKLASKGYRRAGKSFHARVRTASGLPTMAFKVAETIEDFVHFAVNEDNDFEAWKWATSKPQNITTLITSFTTQPVAEAPDLVEDHHLRSYEGDIHGRGAGVYDERNNVFWPYMVADWGIYAKDITLLRRELKGDPNYVLTPPDRMNSICIIHLQLRFPYNTHHEDTFFAQFGRTLWRRAAHYECKASEELKGEEAQALAREVHESLYNGCTGELVGSHIPCTPMALGCEWQQVNYHGQDEDRWKKALTGFEVIVDDRLARALSGELGGSKTWFSTPHGDVTSENAYIRVGDMFFMPLAPEPLQRYAHVSSSTIASIGGKESISRYAWVRLEREDGETLFYMPATERTWLDCNTPEIDTIYDCQKFDEHDKWMLNAIDGRLFFHGHEYDTYEFVPMREGIGGSGKSTGQKVQMKFWPQHRIGTMNAKMQEDFGFSDLADKWVIFCSEMSKDTKVPEEHFKNAASFEVISMNVKFNDPRVQKWIAPMSLCGNCRPTNWNDAELAITRRLAGVDFTEEIKNRKGDIMDIISRERLGHVHRKEIIAYYDFVRMYGTIDPMSQPDRLPKAFALYYQRGCCKADPFLAFMNDSSWISIDKNTTGNRRPQVLVDDLIKTYRSWRTSVLGKGSCPKVDDSHMKRGLDDKKLRIERGTFTDPEKADNDPGRYQYNARFILGLVILKSGENY